MWKEWRAQPEAARPAFVEACLGYMVIDFLALCQGAGPSVSPLSSLRSAAGGRLLRPLVSRACRPQTHALPRPPEPRAARTRSAARCEGSSRKHGIIAESAPERSESCRQRVQTAAQGEECGVFSTSAVSQRQSRACPPEPPFRSTIGVQASPHVALGWQDSAQSSHPPKRELSQEQLERMETNRLAALAKLNGLLRNSSQCVACKE